MYGVNSGVENYKEKNASNQHSCTSLHFVFFNTVTHDRNGAGA